MDYIFNEYNRLKIEENLKKILFYEDAKDLSLEWGMNYITFAPSKRVRPLLLLESNLIFNEIDFDAYILASSVELIHTYSLVHDDLPCMDNDELRRGLKTLHIVKNEAYAVLAGDALLTKSFGILEKYSKVQKLPEILYFLSQKSGHNGMIYGQYLDMENENKLLSIDEINKINYYKTSSLLQLSLILGAINCSAEVKYIEILEKLGEVFGYLFQIKDDILDIEGDEQILGKKTHQDKKNNKKSIPELIGIENAKKLLLDYKQKALEQINLLPSNKEFFIKFVDFLIEREK